MEASASIHKGAQALRDLVTQLGNMAERDLVRDSDDDTRDYAAMADAVGAALQTHFLHTDKAHRQGFTRALTSLLSIVADGCAPSAQWNPMAETAGSFKEAPASEPVRLGNPIDEVSGITAPLLSALAVLRLTQAAMPAGDAEIIAGQWRDPEGVHDFVSSMETALAVIDEKARAALRGANELEERMLRARREVSHA